MKKFSNDFWKRIFNGEESCIFKQVGQYRKNKEYTNFVDQLMEKADEGCDISKVKHLKDIMRDIIFYFILDEDFICEYRKFMDWNLITKYQKLSEDFIEQFKKNFDWYNVCLYQILSEKFIRKHIKDFDKSCWDEICGKEENKLSMDFMREFADYINWDFIGESQCYDKNFLREFADKINFSYYNLNMNKHVLMKQEETLEFQPGFEDTVNWNVKVMDVCRGNYDKKRRFQDNAGTN